MKSRTQFELPLYRINASLYYFIYGDKESHISQQQNIECHVLWTVNTHQKQVKENQTKPIVTILFLSLSLLCVCVFLLLSVEWVYARHFFFDPLRHHTMCVSVCSMHRTETEFGMLISFFGMNKILVLLEVATYCFIMVSDECSFCCCLLLFQSVCFRFRLRFWLRFDWIGSSHKTQSTASVACVCFCVNVSECTKTKRMVTFKKKGNADLMLQMK